MRTAHCKHKLLILQKILLEKTDEGHPLTVAQIIDELAKYDIGVERKTVYDDMETLINCGLDIIVDKKSHANAYYVGERVFQIEELQVLADAVASSKFLSLKKSNELIKKLQSLTSVHNLKTLKRSIYVEDRVKAFNENIYYNINAIQQALSDNKKITFKYFQYTAAKKKQYKNNGLPYRVSPYHIVWQNDNYYLVCYCEKHNNISRYRIDRMLNVCVGEEKRKPVSVDEILLVDNLCSTFGMYGGERKEVVLKLHNDLVNVIIDRYGKDVYMRKEDNEHFIAFVEVQISPPFWGWLFQFGDKAQIISPEDVVNEAKDYIRKLEGIYKK